MYLITYSNLVSSDRILLEKASLAQPYHVIDDRVYGEFIIDMSRLYDMADGDSLNEVNSCLLYTSPSPRDRQKSRMPSSA